VRRIFITGASSGIGAALARHYAALGSALGLVARRANLLEALAVELGDGGARVTLYPGDVSDTAFMQEASNRFLEAEGGADVVIANAGIGLSKPLAAAGAERVARLWAVNTTGVSNTLVPFIPALISQRSGVLVAMSSVAGFRALPGNTVYSASKAAIIAFMDGLRMELSGTGVHAMTICPGFVRTPLTEKNQFPQPFMLEAERAAELMSRAIEARKNTYTLPWQMRFVKGGLRLAPEALLRRVISATSGGRR
jgi:hypothetical protein